MTRKMVVVGALASALLNSQPALAQDRSRGLGELDGEAGEQQVRPRRHPRAREEAREKPAIVDDDGGCLREFFCYRPPNEEAMHPSLRKERWKVWAVSALLG